MLQDRRAVIEQVRRLALIRAIASLEIPKRERGADANANRRALDAEQELWFARPSAERKRYAGEYVAVHGGEVVDHDPDQRALYLRVRGRYGRRPVLIVRADWNATPDFTIHSPRLEHQSHAPAHPHLGDLPPIQRRSTRVPQGRCGFALALAIPTPPLGSRTDS